MKWLYRITLIIAGCYFESAIRNVVQMSLYWIERPDVLKGFLPYIVPVFMGYVYALEAREHWSQNRLKNDIMAYMGSTVLIGYPLLVSISLWLAGRKVEAATSSIRIVSTAVLALNLAIAVLVWRKAVREGMPFSLPWGTVTEPSAGNSADAGESDGCQETNAVAETDKELDTGDAKDIVDAKDTGDVGDAGDTAEPEESKPE